MSSELQMVLARARESSERMEQTVAELVETRKRLDAPYSLRSDTEREEYRKLYEAEIADRRADHEDRMRRLDALIKAFQRLTDERRKARIQSNQLDCQ